MIRKEICCKRISFKIGADFLGLVQSLLQIFIENRIAEILYYSDLVNCWTVLVQISYVIITRILNWVSICKLWKWRIESSKRWMKLQCSNFLLRYLNFNLAIGLACEQSIAGEWLLCYLKYLWPFGFSVCRP